jgi:hypothetical protein
MSPAHITPRSLIEIRFNVILLPTLKLFPSFTFQKKIVCIWGFLSYNTEIRHYLSIPCHYKFIIIPPHVILAGMGLILENSRL